MRSSNRHGPNIETLTSLVDSARQAGAEFLALPEASGLVNRNVADARAIIGTETDDPFLLAARRLAKEANIWLHTGSTPLRTDANEPRFVNRSHLIAPDGSIVARYDKIHLFDVALADGVIRRESDRYAPGTEAVLAQTPWGPLGLTVCYDLRFPHLFRDYAKRGARIMLVPSAFTVPTGRAHWEILLRARAIENGAFIVAAAQAGRHDDGRETWGHSLIIDPWGDVVADLGTEPGIFVHDLDLTHVESARRQIPSLANERAYAPPV
ncbi:carbon-nitrogen hydrolase family protein [Agrobacterium sp. CNPSo 2736]|nr:carbon-nitrogen hydrolase family protein [Agrobacterium sp. CNPSo 2736]